RTLACPPRRALRRRHDRVSRELDERLASAAGTPPAAEARTSGALRVRTRYDARSSTVKAGAVAELAPPAAPAMTASCSIAAIEGAYHDVGTTLASANASSC